MIQEIIHKLATDQDISKEELIGTRIIFVQSLGKLDANQKDLKYYYQMVNGKTLKILK